MAGRLPGVRLRTWAEVADQAGAGRPARVLPGIEVAVVWKPDPAMWAAL